MTPNFRKQTEMILSSAHKNPLLSQFQNYKITPDCMLYGMSWKAKDIDTLSDLKRLRNTKLEWNEMKEREYEALDHFQVGAPGHLELQLSVDNSSSHRRRRTGQKHKQQRKRRSKKKTDGGSTSNTETETDTEADDNEEEESSSGEDEGNAGASGYHSDEDEVWSDDTGGSWQRLMTQYTYDSGELAEQQVKVGVGMTNYNSHFQSHTDTPFQEHVAPKGVLRHGYQANNATMEDAYEYLPNGTMEEMKPTKLMRFNATKQCHVDLLSVCLPLIALSHISLYAQHLTAIKSKSQRVQSETYQDPKVIATWTTKRMREDEAINKRNQELEEMYRDKMEALMRHIYLMKREIDQHRVEQAKVKELSTNMKKEFETEIKEKILSQENKIKQQELEKNLYDMTTFESEEVSRKRKAEENKLKEKHTEVITIILHFDHGDHNIILFCVFKLREKIEERRKEYTAKNCYVVYQRIIKLSKVVFFFFFKTNFFFTNIKNTDVKLLGDYKYYKELNRQLEVQSKLVAKEYFAVEAEYRTFFASAK
ncbi:hypothetical protein RFI_11467 [Reticulomyxa filosa]|uniref:Uncharacterized protein n=1 Tax=Reticulomyxa filosa TaxID=46433 RepID=X6NJY1_RETFI|nr:hypothetical protein RFI_11467 [Reticulomyxa filosa]|eukprot:ETO25667.1 hypothetical protein RFI_11467 [Reticulomyxa filosa]